MTPQRLSYIPFMSTSPLLILGLNPAWQRLFVMDRLLPGAVHRLPKGIEFASGKGINLARMLALQGESSVLLQFAGGRLGDSVVAELDRVGLFHATIRTEGETRICTTLTEAEGCSTELIEPSQKLTKAELDEFFLALEPLWLESSHIAICGTAPLGFAWDRLCVQSIAGHSLYLDAWTGVEPWLAQGPRLLKVNAEELAKLLGHNYDCECLDVHALGKELLARWPVQTLVVTQGSRRVLAFQKQGVISLCPPRPRKFVNAIGAGDSFLAGWISADRAGFDWRGCLARAVAISAVRCEAELPWELDVAQVAVVEMESLGRIQELV